MAKIAVIAFCGLLKVFNNCDVSVIFSESGSMRIVDDILLEHSTQITSVANGNSLSFLALRVVS